MVSRNCYLEAYPYSVNVVKLMMSVLIPWHTCWQRGYDLNPFSGLSCLTPFKWCPGSASCICVFGTTLSKLCIYSDPISNKHIWKINGFAQAFELLPGITVCFFSIYHINHIVFFMHPLETLIWNIIYWWNTFQELRLTCVPKCI